MIDYIKLGAAVAEYQDRCRAIDAEIDRIQIQALQGAMAALLRGDLAERTRLCDLASRVAEKAPEAKLELGLRIAERLGLDRDDLEREVRRRPRPAAAPARNASR